MTLSLLLVACQSTDKNLTERADGNLTEKLANNFDNNEFATSREKTPFTRTIPAGLTEITLPLPGLYLDENKNKH